MQRKTERNEDNWVGFWAIVFIVIAVAASLIVTLCWR